MPCHSCLCSPSRACSTAPSCAPSLLAGGAACSFTAGDASRLPGERPGSGGTRACQAGAPAPEKLRSAPGYGRNQVAALEEIGRWLWKKLRNAWALEEIALHPGDWKIGREGGRVGRGKNQYTWDSIYECKRNYEGEDGRSTRAAFCGAWEISVRD